MKRQELLRELIIKCLRNRREGTIKEIRHSLYDSCLLPLLDYAKRESRLLHPILKKNFCSSKRIEKEINFTMFYYLPSVLNYMYKKGLLLRRKRKTTSFDYNCKKYLWSYYLPTINAQKFKDKRREEDIERDKDLSRALLSENAKKNSQRKYCRKKLNIPEEKWKVKN